MSADRVIYAVLHVPGGVARVANEALSSRSDAACVQLRRPVVLGRTTTTAGFGTGAGARRHRVFTRLVPAQGATEGLMESMVEADLRPRTSRDSGAPFIWNRLADRGVTSAVIGWPYRPAQDEERVLELDFVSLKRIATKNRLSSLEAMLGAARGGLEARPDIRCLCLYGYFNSEVAESLPDAEEPEGEEEDGGEEQTEAEGPSGAEDRDRFDRLFAAIEALQQLADAPHAMIALVGPRIGRLVVLGPKARPNHASFAMANACVPTVLSMLGEPRATDLPGQSLVADEQDVAEDSSGWVVEGGALESNDFGPAIERTLAGEGGDLLRGVVRRYLEQANWVGITDGDRSMGVEAARTLLRMGSDPADHIRLIFSMINGGDPNETLKAAEALMAAHPDSPLAEIVQTLKAMGRSDEEVNAILDRHSGDSLPGPLSRAIRARAAARVGRKDEALASIWRLIASGYALTQDRVLYATLALDRLADGDPERAVLATRGVTGLEPGPDGRPRTRLAMLRARALALSGRRPMAMRVLETFLGRYPMERAAREMLEGLQTTPVDGD